MTPARFKLTIASGDTISSTMADVYSPSGAEIGLGAGTAISLLTPATLTGALTIELKINDSAWATLQDSTLSDVVPTAGTIIVLPLGISGSDIRIVSGTAEAADRDFYLSIQEDS